jgi:predicted  nucleic acid-binding Zn-ribbon protein
LFHLDFTATIRTDTGKEEYVMIELQKAYVQSDIFRFKRYICQNFQTKIEREVKETTTGQKISKKFPIRLIPIFILNFTIDCGDDLMLIIKKQPQGVFKGEIKECLSYFIEHLNYDMYIVQLPNIAKINEAEYKNDEYKSKLYTFLTLFNQQSIIDDKGHRLRVFKALYPKEYRRLIQRLQAASKDNPDLEEQMNVEDEYLTEMINLQNDIAFLKDKLEQAKIKAEQERKEKEQAKQKAEQERKEKEEARKREEQAKQREKEAMRKLAKKMKKYGESIDEIMKETGLTRDEIEKL